MTLKSKPYYWAVCDGQDCKSRCPAGDFEVDAWGDLDGVESDLDESGWIKIDAGKHYCPDCYQIDDDGEPVPTSLARSTTSEASS